MLGHYCNTLYEACSWVTSLRTTAWWMRLLISSSDVAPCLLVFRRMRATFPSSSPEWGRSGSPSPTSSRCVFSVRRSSSIGSGKVKALPLAPKRCLARWAVESKGGRRLVLLLVRIIPGFHSHASQCCDARARANHLHDGDLSLAQEARPIPDPHVVCQALRRQLAGSEVFGAVGTERHLAFFAQELVPNMVWIGAAAMVLRGTSVSGNRSQ